MSSIPDIIAMAIDQQVEIKGMHDIKMKVKIIIIHKSASVNQLKNISE